MALEVVLEVKGNVWYNSSGTVGGLAVWSTRLKFVGLEVLDAVSPRKINSCGPGRDGGET